MQGDNVQGRWKLVHTNTFNCRSEPCVGDNVVHVFHRGDEVEVEEHIEKDWCLLAGPSGVKGAYIRLRSGSSAHRCWTRIIEDAGDKPDEVRTCVSEKSPLQAQGIGCRWRLVGTAHNCRSQPCMGDNVVHVFHSGDVVEVEQHMKDDWVLLAGPAVVKGAYLRLRHGKSATRCWVRDQHASITILLVGNGRDPNAHYPNVARWLRSGDRNVNLVIRHHATMDWSDQALEVYDAIVLSGGTGLEEGSRDKYKAALLRTEKPVLGICFGMQWICRSYWQAEKKGHFHLTQVSKSRGCVLEKLHVPELSLKGRMEYHRMWGVPPKYIADSLVALALDDAKATVAVVQHVQKPVLGFQGHPECPHTERVLQQRLLQIFFSMIDQYQRSRKIVSGSNHWAPDTAGVAGCRAKVTQASEERKRKANHVCDELEISEAAGN